CGRARVLDVRPLLGTTNKGDWPASPEITAEFLQKYEKEHGKLHAGEVVIFQSGWSDEHLKPFPRGSSCMSDPLVGLSERWPEPGAGATGYRVNGGVRCVATDAPRLGGVEPKRALWTYWMLGSKGMAGVEYLTNVRSMPEGAFFLFAAIKIRGCHGG